MVVLRGIAEYDAAHNPEPRSREIVPRQNGSPADRREQPFPFVRHDPEKVLAKPVHGVCRIEHVLLYRRRSARLRLAR